MYCSRQAIQGLSTFHSHIFHKHSAINLLFLSLLHLHSLSLSLSHPVHQQWCASSGNTEEILKYA